MIDAALWLSAWLQTHTKLPHASTVWRYTCDTTSSWHATSHAACDLTGFQHRYFTLLLTQLEVCVCVCVRVHVLHLHRLRCLVGRWSDSVSTCSSSLLWHPTRGKTKPERQRQEDEQRWKYTQHRNIFLAWCHFSITRRRTSSSLSHHQTAALCTKCNYKLKVLN